MAAYADAHWVFVSTVNVYADDATPGGTPATLPLVEAIEEDVDLKEKPEAYGPMKVACERIVLDGAASAMVIRPGLIVGPEDPTGRFSLLAAPARAAGRARCSRPATRPTSCRSPTSATWRPGR